MDRDTSFAERVELVGSGRNVVAGATRVGSLDPEAPLTVTLVVRRPSPEHLLAWIEAQSQLSPLLRSPMSQTEFETKHGIEPADLHAISSFAAHYGLTVEKTHIAAGTVHLSGPVRAMNEAFGIELSSYQHKAFSYRGHEGPVYIPSTLSSVVTDVLGLDSRPQAHPHFRVAHSSLKDTRASATQVAYSPLQVAQLYNFPTDTTGTGQCIGIIELGGGYQLSNLTSYFTSLGLVMPSITSVDVDGGLNQPSGNTTGPDGEVDLDIEVAGAIAPGARIVVYFAPNTDAGFLNAITTAIHDTTNKPNILSISWGGPENSWTSSAIQSMNRALQDAAALGVTVCCAAGDNGSTDGVNDGAYHVDFPASSPYVLACGGTTLQASGNVIEQEVVWNDGQQGGATGGGVSAVFPLPAWQANANVPPSANPGGYVGRGVPDVAGDADPATGYQVLVDGQSMAIGGTSAVAPLWAGLLALANAKLGHSLGYLNPTLYGVNQSIAFHDITSGTNDTVGTGEVYAAGPGWDPCTGLGSPNGDALIQVLSR